MTMNICNIDINSDEITVSNNKHVNDNRTMKMTMIMIITGRKENLEKKRKKKYYEH